MSWRAKMAEWAIKAVANDRMSAEQFINAVFGPNQAMPRLGSKELLAAYSSMPWFRAVVGRVSWSTASVPWQLFAATSAPDKRHGKIVRMPSLARSMDPMVRMNQYKALRRDDSLREITTHPALELLDHGNPKFPGQVVRQVTQQHLDMVGEAVWVIERSGLALPTDIYPVPPTWVLQTPSRNNPAYIISGPSGTRTVPEEDVIYFYHPDPQDPYNRGTGIGHVLGDELETDEYTAKHLKRWFRNYAIPPFIVSMPDVKKEGKDRFEENWIKKLLGKGPQVPIFTNREIKVHELMHTFQEMGLQQLRKDERDIIIHVYGLPPEVFGILENSNRSTIDAADYMMAKYVMIPRLEFMRIILQMRLIEKYDDRLILDYVSPVMEDKEFELKVMQGAPYAFTVDELRELANRPPDKTGAGEGRVVPINVTWVPDLQSLATEPTEPSNAPPEE